MKIPTNLLSNIFIAEILDLFKVKTKHQENLILIEDTYLSELFFDPKKRLLKFKSYIYMKKADESILNYLNFLMNGIDSKIKINLNLSNSNELLNKLVFIFEYDLGKSKYIEDLEILNLHNYYESLLYRFYYFCREINLGKTINNIDFLKKN
tara:strand:- start:281 stop:736 length:456 start_codon:yes stop_codon:yes gene_type:complete